MDASLLATKVRIPEHAHAVVARAHLSNALEQGIVRHRLTVISAPAGYGKTTLLTQWARSTTTPVAWLSIDEDDNDPERLLRYLLAAWERIWPAIGDGPLALLLRSQNPNPQAALSAFVNAAAQLETDQVFVLDDYHLIQEAAVHEGLTFLLDHLPARLHFAVATRADPPLPLARYRARGQLLELGAEHLRFSLEEAAAFLQHAMGLELRPEEIERWQAQLEGWAAGLQLAAISLRHRSAPGPSATTLSGQQRYIADYLSQDVLQQLPAALRDFLLETSLLERLCGSLCEAVTGRAGGQAMLEQLERQNLFVAALDDERRWFRYHPLFADFLQGELGRRPAEAVAELHRRAAAWYAAHDLPEPAYEHALAGHDRERVIEIAEGHLMVKLWRGEYRVVRHWVDSVPEEWSSGYPLFGLVRAGALALAGAFDAAARSVDEVEQRLVRTLGPDPSGQMARVWTIRCAMACSLNDLPLAETYGDQALRDLAPNDFFFRAMINLSLGDTYRLNGRWGEAQERYRAALDLSRRFPYRFTSVPPLGALADLDLRQGRLRQAAEHWRQALAVIQEPESWGSLELPLVGWVYIRLGEILYEWNQIDEAWEYLSQGLERAELGGDVRATIAGCVDAGRLKLSEGDLEAAGSYLERAAALVKEAQFRDWAARLQRVQVECWLAQDRLQEAVGWAEETLANGVVGQPESEAAQLGVARVLVVKGDAAALEAAMALLDRLMGTAQAEGRMGVVVEALALQALARQARGERPSALVALERALRLAEPEGYVRLFVDLGLPLGRLLQEARGRRVMSDYVQRLLAAFASAASASPLGAAGLPEPLTERELEVLRLLAAGLTNRQIAERLVISPETVKKHSGNIYGKLGAGNRTEAVARARELDLLD